MAKVKVSFPGTPVSQGRARFSRGHFYDPSAKEKKLLMPLLLQQISSLKEPLKGPLWLHATFFFPFPQASSKAFAEENFHCFREKKPDLDNLLKFYLDLFTNVVYKDDNQICSLSAIKVFAPQGETKITVSDGGIQVAIEHVLVYKKELSQEDVFAIARKAHTLGLAGRDILRSFVSEDARGKHLFFEVEGLREKNLLK